MRDLTDLDRPGARDARSEFWGEAENPDIANRQRRRGDKGRQWTATQREWTQEQISRFYAWIGERDLFLEQKFFHVRRGYDALVLQLARARGPMCQDAELLPEPPPEYAAMFWTLRQVEHERALLARLQRAASVGEPDLPLGDALILDFYEMFLRESELDRRKAKPLPSKR